MDSQERRFEVRVIIIVAVVFLAVSTLGPVGVIAALMFLS